MDEGLEQMLLEIEKQPVRPSNKKVRKFWKKVGKSIKKSKLSPRDVKKLRKQILKVKT